MTGSARGMGLIGVSNYLEILLGRERLCWKHHATNQRVKVGIPKQKREEQEKRSEKGKDIGEEARLTNGVSEIRRRVGVGAAFLIARQLL